MLLRLATVISVLLAATACRRGEDDARQRYLEARSAYGAVYARTFDASCPEEPACERIVEVLSSHPADHADAAEARKVLAQIERARAARAEANEVPAFLRPPAPTSDEVPAPDAAPGPDDLPESNDGLGSDGVPKLDEVPAFLKERIGTPDAAPAIVPIEHPTSPITVVPNADTLRQAPTSGAESGRSTVLGIDRDRAPEKQPAFTKGGYGETDAIEIAGSAWAAPPPAPGSATDPCAPLRERLAKRRDWLARTAAERNTLAHVIDPKDHAALLQLRTMQRCATNPDDPDCAPPPLTATVERFEVDLDELEREPGELVFDPDNPDAIAHDNVVHVLEGRLRKCEAAREG